jgi:hypothetical protein
MQMHAHYIRAAREPSDEIRPVAAARILGISRTAVYQLISVLEHYVHSPSCEVRPLPDDYRRLADRRARAAWRRAHLVVIPEWGAESMGGADWRISRTRLTAWAYTDGHRIPQLLLQARLMRSSRAPNT